jgi:S1/P1 Nuclease
MRNRPRFSRILPRLIVSLMLVVGAIGESGPAWAWGDLGHKIVCQIAFQELNDKARAEVIRLIALDEKFDSFTDACTWPDHPRQRAEEHFINVPRTLQTIATAQCQGASTCLFRAIVTDREVLRTSTDDTAKLASLKFLGHWVGDIHQPLHVSFADDRGGNFIRESGPCVNSLHTVWDTCIIEKKLGADPMTVGRAGPPRRPPRERQDRLGGDSGRGLGERVLSGHPPQVRGVLRPSRH